MATIEEIIKRVDETKPNDFSERIKLRWIALLDGKVATSVYLLDIAEAQKQAYVYPDDLKKEPLIEFPYDDLYDLWLGAKIDFENGEYNKYQNTMEMFNSHYNDFVRWLADTYEPSQGIGCGSNRYFISAYGLAVKHGFVGTEEEYLRSLIGTDGSNVVLRYENNTIQWRRENNAQWNHLFGVADIKSAIITQTIIDATLSIAGYAADAAAVGDRFQNLKAEDVGAAPASHAESKGNPHGVTASQVGARPDTWLPTIADIGAAPAGLIAKSCSVSTESDVDQTILDELQSMGNDAVEFLLFNPTSSDILSGCGTYCELYHRSGGYATAIFTSYANNSAMRMYKHVQNFVCSPFEYENPPMLTGVEYRTTERWNGKAVYAKRIYFGYLPNGATVDVPHEISGKTWNVRYSIDTNQTNRLFDHCPEITSVYADSTNISISTDSDLSATAVYFTLWYTKS